MLRRNSCFILLLSSVLFLSSINLNAQKEKKRDMNPFDNKYTFVKNGPAFGVEYGKRTLVMFGVERNWKQFKLIKPNTKAVSFDILVGMQPNYMGAQIGGWFKEGRTSLLFGGNLVWCTNFTHHRFGIAPFVGIKVWQAQLRAGVNIRPVSPVFKEVNVFFLCLRFAFVNDMKLKKKQK